MIFMRIDVFRSERVLFQVNEFLLSELSILVNTDLGINAVYLVFGVDCPRVDLNLNGITVSEHLVKCLYLVSETRAFLEFKIYF